MVPVDSLELHPDNPREGNVEAISRSIRENGFYGVCLVQKSTRRIIVGKHRYLGAIQEGQKKVPVLFLDVDDAKAKRIMLADNRTSDIATDNEPQLKAVLEGILKEQGDLEGTGYSADDLEELVASLNPPQIIEDEAPPISKRARSKKGRIYKLGSHRLLCGDSTKEADVKKLLGKEKADMVFTDPPYSVDYDRSQSERGGSVETHAPYREHGSKPEQVLSFMKIIRSDVLVMTYPLDRHFFALARAMAEAEFEFRKELVWVKDRFSFWPGSSYQQAHEPILICVRKGKPLNARTEPNDSTVLRFDRPKKHEEHPTQKPLALWAKLITNHTKKNDTVYDPFGGSGSTLIACEQLNRRCLMVEIEPRYCDVIRKRWWKFVNGSEKGWEKVTSA